MTGRHPDDALLTAHGVGTFWRVYFVDDDTDARFEVWCASGPTDLIQGKYGDWKAAADHVVNAISREVDAETVAPWSARPQCHCGKSMLRLAGPEDTGLKSVWVCQDAH